MVAVSFFQHRLPVEDKGHGRSDAGGRRHSQQEALAVARDVIVEAEAGDRKLGGEQGVWNAELEGRSAGSSGHIHGHQFSVAREIEQLFAIAPPARLGSARGGDAPTPGSAVAGRKGANVNLEVVRVERGVSEPAGVGGGSALSLEEGGIAERDRLQFTGA